MKKKFSIFLAFFLVSLWGMQVWAASYIPPTTKSIEEYTVVYATDSAIVGGVPSAGAWACAPAGVAAWGNRSYNPVAVTNTINNPGAIEDVIPSGSGLTMVQIKTDGNKYNGNSRAVHFNVKGIKGVIVHGVTGNSNRGMAIGYNEAAGLAETAVPKVAASINGDNSTFGANGSMVLATPDSLFDADKAYIITVYAMGSDGGFYAIEFIPADEEEEPIVNEPGGGTPAGINPFVTSDSVYYRIICYGSAMSSSANFSGAAKYLTIATKAALNANPILTTTTAFAGDDAAILWDITPVPEKEGYFYIKNVARGSYFSTAGGTGDFVLASSTAEPIAITYGTDATVGSDSYSFYRICREGPKQIRPNAWDGRWYWDQGTNNRADMVFTIVSISKKVAPEGPYLVSLNNAIATAQDIVSKAAVGTGFLEYPQTAVDTLNAAIVTAQTYLTSLVQADIDSAEKNLNDAITLFDTKKSLVFSIDETKYYRIFSIGRPGGTGTTSASYLYDNEGTLSPATDFDSTGDFGLWELFGPGEGQAANAMTIKNVGSGKYMTVASLSETPPADLYVVYKKNDGGKPCFAIAATTEGTGAAIELNAATTVRSNTYADRERWRWAFEAVADKPIKPSIDPSALPFAINFNDSTALVYPGGVGHDAIYTDTITGNQVIGHSENPIEGISSAPCLIIQKDQPDGCGGTQSYYLRFNRNSDYIEATFAEAVGRLYIRATTNSGNATGMVVTCMKASDRTQLWQKTYPIAKSACIEVDTTNISTEPCIIKINKVADGGYVQLYEMKAEAPRTKIAYVTASGLVGSEAAANSADSRDVVVYPALQSLGDVTLINAGSYTSAVDSATVAALFADYDLVVASESVGGTNSLGVALKNLVGVKPFLNFKAFFYTVSGRWGWAAPSNGVTGGTGHSVVINGGFATHPVFSGVTVSNDSVRLFTELAETVNADKKGVQGFTLPINSGNTDAFVADASSTIKSIHEINTVPEAKYMMLPLCSDNYNNINENGVNMIKNAVAYLLSDSVFVPVFSTEAEITSFSLGVEGENALIIAPAGEVNGKVKIILPVGTDTTALIPAIGISKGATINPASGVSQNFTSPVTYTVTAEDGVTTAVYDVTVVVKETVAWPININFTNSESKVKYTANGSIYYEPGQPDVVVVAAGGANGIDLEPEANGVGDCGTDTKGQMRFNHNGSVIEITLDKPLSLLRVYGSSGSGSTDVGMVVTCLKASDRTELWKETTQLGTNSARTGCMFEKLNASTEPVIIRISRTGATLNVMQVYAEAVSASSEAAITSFSLGVQGESEVAITVPTAEANGKVEITVPAGTAITALTPVIGISAGATISPEGAQDFTNTVTYTVTAEDGVTAALYDVKVSVATSMGNTTADKVPAFTEYFDLVGKAISKDAKGFVIVKVTYEDGSSSIQKQFVE